MLFILLFHLFCGYELQPWKTLFGRGFYGVDIFLFFSALGLCFSYNKNSLSLFYYNRVKRVLPLFFILAIFRLVWHICCGNSVSTWDVVATMTGLSYLKVLGGIWVDWYLCALLILYAMFPIIYRYIKDRCLGGGDFCFNNIFFNLLINSFALGTCMFDRAFADFLLWNIFLFHCS